VLSENPDLLIVEFVNDYAMPISQVDADFCSILEKAKAQRIDVILCTPHLLRPKYMQLKTWIEAANHPYILKLRELSRRFGVGLADVSKRWEKLNEEGLSPELMLSDDTLHINDRGHQIYAEELMNCFN
jgi:lysophospholipase L1-like esterase